MRNPRMGCLVLVGLLAVFVLVFFNSGPQAGVVQPSGGIDGSSAGGGGAAGGADGELEPLGGLDGDGGDLESLDGDDDGDGVSLDLGGDDSDADSGSDGELGELTDVIETQVSDVNYEVMEAYNQGDSIFDEVMADGQFVVVTLDIENSGDVPLTYLGANMVDDLGQEYSYIPEAIPYIEEDQVCEGVALEPGESRVCQMVYDINSDASAVGIILTDLNLLGAEEEIVELQGLP